jgi:hypothetical protein
MQSHLKVFQIRTSTYKLKGGGTKFLSSVRDPVCRNFVAVKTQKLVRLKTLDNFVENHNPNGHKIIRGKNSFFFFFFLVRLEFELAFVFAKHKTP